MQSTRRPRTRAALLAAAAAAALAATAHTAAAQTSDSPARAEDLPSSFSWESTGPLIGPSPDAEHDPASVKDPSIVHFEGEYHLFATIAGGSSGYNLVYTHFEDWSQAGSAEHHYLDQSGIGIGYRAAPQVFYFEPQGLWYLVYQDGNAAYSTNPDITDPGGWTAPQHFYPSMPQIIEDNIGDGYWVDMWVTCDEADCHLFSSDDNGHLYRSETPVGNFPDGMSDPVMAMQDSDRTALFEAANVYKIAGSDRYLILVEAFDDGGTRYFRSWTATDIAGPYTPLADSRSNPFADTSNVVFPGGQWTNDISHGEMIRSGIDQRLEIEPCRMQYLYQGVEPGTGLPYDDLPWRLGLLTQTDSGCDPEDPTAPDEPTVPATGDCTAAVAVVDDWGPGWQGEVTVTAGDAGLDGWRLSWDWDSGQQISSAWNADWSQSGTTVTAADIGWNGQLAAHESRQVFGFIASGPAAPAEPDCTAA